MVLYQLPYSEHSSYTELRQFVQWLRPISIIPSVGNDKGPKCAKMIQLLQQPASHQPPAPTTMHAFLRKTPTGPQAAA